MKTSEETISRREEAETPNPGLPELTDNQTENVSGGRPAEADNLKTVPSLPGGELPLKKKDREEFSGPDDCASPSFKAHIYQGSVKTENIVCKFSIET